jgi:hypothetical protein
VWQVTARITEERGRREVRPVEKRPQALADGLAPAEEDDDRSEPDRHLHGRLQNLIELMKVFGGGFEDLLPVVNERDEAFIRQLTSMAQSLQEAPPSTRASAADE